MNTHVRRSNDSWLWVLCCLLLSVVTYLVTIFFVRDISEFVYSDDSGGLEAAVYTIGAAFIFPVLVAVSVFLALREAFARDSSKTHWIKIVLCYFSTAVIFSAAYYWLINVTDAVDATKQYRCWHSFTQGEVEEKNRCTGNDNRAFNGIEERLWDGINQIVDLREGDEGRRLEVARQVVELASGPISEAVQFGSNAEYEVLLDATYFSVITITTLGYGDVTPNHSVAKLLAMMEVVLGMSIIVVALGRSFSA